MGIQKVCVVGLGYIGLPTAAMFASRKIHVHGVDIDQRVVDVINQGKIHIVEPDLDMLVHASVREGFLKASLEAEAADAFLIAVPTPFRGENHDPDLSYIESACRKIAPFLKKGDLVVLESTSPVGTTELMINWMSGMRPDLVFAGQEKNASAVVHVAYCPERVLPGNVLRELVGNDRVIGGITPQCAEKATLLYKIFVSGECVQTNARTAEMVKLTENSFRDVNIAFANELSVICDEIDVNVWELIRLANRHPRVKILQPGPGVGGHCIAVDPWFIVSRSPESARLIRTARIVNDDKPNWVLEKVDKVVGDFLKANPKRTLEGVTIGCFGLAFKPDIDDLRESPALQIAKVLAAKHPGKVLAVEPNIEALPSKLEGALKLVGHEDALSVSDVVVLLVDHREFKEIERNKLPMSSIIVDTRGIWT